MNKYLSYSLFHLISAGGVVFKKVKGKIRFAIIERHACKDWTLPKGHQRDKETLQQTARREVFEETGFYCAILDYLGSFTYKTIMLNNRKESKTFINPGVVLNNNEGLNQTN